MSFFNKILLPPILDYSYPAFGIEKNSSLEIIPSLSKTNTIDQVDHLQIRIVSLETNKNALNPSIFPSGFFFIKRKTDSLRFIIPTFMNGYYTFGINQSDPYPSYYKIQIRLGIKNSGNEYNEQWGQNVPKEWILEKAPYFSEWSNCAIIKTTKQPNFGIFSLKEDGINEITESFYDWKGYYNTEDDNESLKRYAFSLYTENHEKIEESSWKYIGEFEIPSLSYNFNEILKNKTNYIIRITIETVTGYQSYKEYFLYTNFPYIKIYNIVNVTENNLDGSNSIEVKAKQMILETDADIDERNWLADKNFSKYGEEGITHLKIKENQHIRTPKGNFIIPYSNFSIILSITNFLSKKQTRVIDCFVNNNWIVEVSDDQKESDFKIGCYEQDGKAFFVLRSAFRDFINFYYIPIKREFLKENQEFLLNITNDNGRISFSGFEWHENLFN